MDAVLIYLSPPVLVAEINGPCDTQAGGQLKKYKEEFGRIGVRNSYILLNSDDLSSMFLGSLIAIHSHSKSLGGMLKLVIHNQATLQRLKELKLHDYFEIFPSLFAAGFETIGIPPQTFA